MPNTSDGVEVFRAFPGSVALRIEDVGTNLDQNRLHAVNPVKLVPAALVLVDDLREAEHPVVDIVCLPHAHRPGETG